MTAAGVKGTNIGGTGGVGVYGTGDIGVYGTGTSYGFQTDSNVQQARTAGGWVKGMVFVNGAQPPYTIIRCFNSTLSGAATSTPPCGFGLAEVNGLGEFDVDFGFEVEDRFLSATGNLALMIIACASDICTVPNNHTVYVASLDVNYNFEGEYFNVIVY